MRKTIVTQFMPFELDFELARRQRFPPDSLRSYPDDFKEEWISVADLHAELAATPVTHPDYAWRQWELALAERQQRHHPNSLFYRIVDRTTTNRIAVAE